MKLQKRAKSCIFLLLGLIANSFALNAATYVVTSTADTNTSGTLRFGINQVNAGLYDTINFSIPGSPPYTIVPATNLPTIIMPVTIDGYAGSPGGATPNSNALNDPLGNNAVITVEIRGPGPGVNLPVLNGLRLGSGSDGSVIRGLAINSFANIQIPALNTLSVPAGIRVDSNSSVIEGCFIGTDTFGNPLINARGIRLLGDDDVVGGETVDARNLIIGAINLSGPAGVSVQTPGAATIMGNTIGLSKLGDSSPDTGTNVNISSEGGGPLTITNNVISGATSKNILLVMEFPYPSAQIITDNFIGLDVTGGFAVDHNGNGIVLWAANFENSPNTFLIDGNTISGNTHGILLGQGGIYNPINGAQITNNVIGLDATASLPVPNSQDGIRVAYALNTFIGNNVISANGANGIRVGKAKNSLIQGNLIGTDGTGVVPFGNALNGIQLGVIVGVGVPAFGDIIGGAIVGQGNLIANNGENGIKIVSYTQQEVVQGNTIVDNGQHGIRMGNKSSHNWIGGFRDAGNNLLAGDIIGLANLGPIGTSNLITGNGEDGIKVVGSYANAIQSNIIGAEGSPNDLNGIKVEDSSHNLIGANLGVELTLNPPVLGNVITNNNGYGVLIEEKHGRAVDNSILSNSITDNQRDGIELKERH